MFMYRLAVTSSIDVIDELLSPISTSFMLFNHQAPDVRWSRHVLYTPFSVWVLLCWSEKPILRTELTMTLYTTCACGLIIISLCPSNSDLRLYAGSRRRVLLGQSCPVYLLTNLTSKTRRFDHPGTVWLTKWFDDTINFFILYLQYTVDAKYSFLLTWEICIWMTSFCRTQCGWSRPSPS